METEILGIVLTTVLPLYPMLFAKTVNRYKKKDPAFCPLSCPKPTLYRNRGYLDEGFPIPKATLFCLEPPTIGTIHPCCPSVLY